jgi:2-C-methyl-D-erythritol 4-phosphate cytidylyltransferase
MAARAIIVVGGGASTRFEGEKLLEPVAGKPLIWHTVSAVIGHADRCVLVARPDLVERFADLALEVEIVPGGTTRTSSEMAGLSALGRPDSLIGVHDAARPLVGEELIESLYRRAEAIGGAAPVIDDEAVFVDRNRLKPVDGPMRVQTPQVFRGPELVAAFAAASEAGTEAADTIEIVHEHGKLDIEAVPGDPKNLKVTFPSDLEIVRRRLEELSRT